MKFLERLKRRFLREYVTDSKEKFLRVAKATGVSQDIIDHELKHIEAGEQYGVKPKKFMIYWDPAGMGCRLFYDKSTPREVIREISMAPGFEMSDQDNRTLMRANLGL